MRSLLSPVLMLALALPLSAQVKVEVVADEAEAVLAILAKADGDLKPRLETGNASSKAKGIAASSPGKPGSRT